MTRSTRERIVVESLRLFAERGYSATSVAEIEAASGLSPGAGGLYRHFRSKEEVLGAAVREHIGRARQQMTTTFQHAATLRNRPLSDRLSLVCRLGLAKMREERDLIRVLFRDLDQSPALVAEIREGVVDQLYGMIAAWLCGQPELRDTEEDWAAAALVLGGAVVNYWLANETLHEPPTRVDEDRFVAGWTRLALGLLSGDRAPA